LEAAGGGKAVEVDEQGEGQGGGRGVEETGIKLEMGMITKNKPTQYAMEKSAQAWCAGSTRKKTMDVELAMEFARILDQEVEKMKDAGEYLWVVVANVSGGDWDKQSKVWQKAARKAEIQYHKACSVANRKTA
jgi:hypothetical protein